MNVQKRNHVVMRGTGPETMVFAHGFGCDQNMWRFIEPVYARRCQTLLMDHVGAGASDLSAYCPDKYDTLQGYADDVIEVIEASCEQPVIFVGHSVSAMIGVLANLARPDLFAAQIMIGPSPCYINDEHYTGGFSDSDIRGLLDALDGNYLGWAASITPTILGAGHQPELLEDLTNSFCRTDPEIAKQFARVTFLSDNRADIARLQTPTLVLQCSDDLIAPVDVGRYVHRAIRGSTMRIIENSGHCPHLTAPQGTIDAIDDFLQARGR